MNTPLIIIMFVLASLFSVVSSAGVVILITYIQRKRKRKRSSTQDSDNP
jgi:hypothetical protein